VSSDQGALSSVPCPEGLVGRGGGEKISMRSRVSSDGSDDVLKGESRIMSARVSLHPYTTPISTHLVTDLGPWLAGRDVPNNSLAIGSRTNQEQPLGTTIPTGPSETQNIHKRKRLYGFTLGVSWDPAYDVSVGQVDDSDSTVGASDGEEVGSGCDGKGRDTILEFPKVSGLMRSQTQERSVFSRVKHTDRRVGRGGNQELSVGRKVTGSRRLGVGRKDLHVVSAGHCRKGIIGGQGEVWRSMVDYSHSHCHIQTVPPSQPAANTGPLGCHDIHCEKIRISAQHDLRHHSQQSTHSNLITGIKTGQKLPRPPSLYRRLILIGLLALDTTPDPDFPIHSTGGYHITIRGEFAHDDRVGVSGQSDGLKGGVVDGVFRGRRVWERGQGGEDVGEVVFTSRDGQRRVREGRVERDVKDGRFVVNYE